jgi:uncharacterized NAD-dependent epimerase/dehydratase family protein
MSQFSEGNAIVYCEGAFGSPNGKTAHGLIRRTNRYKILSVIDTTHAGKDAGAFLDGKPNNIPILSTIPEAIEHSNNAGNPATHFVIGLAPDGGRLSPEARESVKQAIQLGLHVDSGLHDFLSEDAEISSLAQSQNVQIRDVRKTAPRHELHFFSGKIEQVKALKVAVLGTDSAVGKRTTAWLIVDALREAGYSAEFVGTGQTAWMQGARYSIMLDSLINDFVSGEIEHAIWSVGNDQIPDVIIIEGQGSLMNPAYPGGFEILAAGRPEAIIMQHAPARKDYDGFPGYPIHPIERQLEAIKVISDKPVVAITINHENLTLEEIPRICSQIQQQTGIPTFDVLLSGANEIVNVLRPYL